MLIYLLCDLTRFSDMTSGRNSLQAPQQDKHIAATYAEFLHPSQDNCFTFNSCDLYVFRLIDSDVVSAVCNGKTSDIHDKFTG